MTAKSILEIVANKDGAHADSSEMTHESISMPINIKLPGKSDELFRRGHWVTFGGISYLHIFTVLVGVYLVNMMKETLDHIPEEKKRHFQIADLSSTIANSPSEIRASKMVLNKNYGMGAVLDSTNDPNNPFALVGDYEKVGTTTIQIPRWKG